MPPSAGRSSLCAQVGEGEELLEAPAPLSSRVYRLSMLRRADEDQQSRLAWRVSPSLSRPSEYSSVHSTRCAPAAARSRARRAGTKASRPVTPRRTGRAATSLPLSSDFSRTMAVEPAVLEGDNHVVRQLHALVPVMLASSGLG